VLQLAEPLALRAKVAGHEVRAPQDPRIELLLPRPVRAHGGDVEPFVEVADGQERLARRSRGNDHGAQARDLGRVPRRYHLDLQLLGDVGYEPTDRLRPAPECDDLPEVADELQGPELEARLHPHADHARRLHRSRGQVLGRDRSRQRRPHLGEVRVVEQEGLGPARLRGQHDHEAARHGQSGLRVGVEAGRDLHREGGEAANVGRLHVDLGLALGHVDADRRGHQDLAAREPDEAVLDGGERLRVDADAGADLGLVQEQEGGGHGISSGVMALT
jgi:hypothetical protein